MNTLTNKKMNMRFQSTQETQEQAEDDANLNNFKSGVFPHRQIFFLLALLVEHGLQIRAMDGKTNNVVGEVRQWKAKESPTSL